MKKVILLSAMLLVCATSFADVGRDGRKTVTTGGTAEAISTEGFGFQNCTVCAETDNTGIIAVGYNPIANLSTRVGIPLSAGQCYTFRQNPSYRSGVLSEIKIDTTVNGDGVTYNAIK